MSHEEASRIIASCMEHGNGRRTLRECADLAGIDYDTAAEAREVARRASIRIGDANDKEPA